MAYQSPIEMIMSDWETKVEGDMVKAVQHYGFNVDKDELLMALQYDRAQYDKGYSDGRFDAMKELVHCRDCKLYEKFKGVKDGGCIYYGIYTNPDDFCSRGERDG